MKRPRPSPPPDVPAGTVQLGGAISWFSASLHVRSDTLDPNAVTAIFQLEPDESQVKGVPRVREDGTTARFVPRVGGWSRYLKPSQTDEWDINEVVRELLTPLPTELDAWRQVANLGEIHVSLGLVLEKDNQDFALDAELLRFLGERSIGIFFDVYDRSTA